MNALIMKDTHDIPNGSIFSCHWVFTTEAFQTIYLIYAVEDALANERVEGYCIGPNQAKRFKTVGTMHSTKCEST
ncbi:hypothetical protein SADUNF_Sadunf03G0122700 [Salix dunnii]|uniref:Uncharacterized protein n=1 Tax=Salix dunnii TaxID=1413687 RepID=A0A835N4H5_9ROSI|nr:hypothetical protein SADUNF_Sadunf03G0122700 [Salix dunnii]